MNAEQKAFVERLYLEMYEMLLSYARASLKEAPLAEEAVQEIVEPAETATEA